MRAKYKRQRGSIALVTVVVIGGILLATGIAVVMLSADLSIATKNYSAKVLMESTLRTCLEESLFRVKADDAFTGNVTYSNGGGDCSALVEDDPVIPETKIVTVDAAYNEYASQQEFTVDISSEPFQVVE